MRSIIGRRVTPLVLCIILLISIIPVVYADPVSTLSAVDAGILATSVYANASGYVQSYTSVGIEAGYEVSQASLQLLEAAINSNDWASTASAIESAYPEAAAAAASAAGVGSLASITTGSQAAAAVGTGVTVGATGSILIAAAVASIIGLGVYELMANSVTIPDYGTSFYRRYGDLIVGNMPTYSTASIGSNTAAWSNNISIGGTTSLYPGKTITVNNHSLTVIQVETSTSSGVIYNYYLRFDNDSSKDLYLGQGATRHIGYNPTRYPIDSSHPLYFILSPVSNYVQAVSYCYDYLVYSSVWGNDAYYILSIHSNSFQSSLLYRLSLNNVSPVASTVRRRWTTRTGVPVTTLPGYPGVASDDIDLTISDDTGVPAWVDPSTALDDYIDTLDTTSTDQQEQTDTVVVPWIIIDDNTTPTPEPTPSPYPWAPNDPIVGDPDSPTDDNDDGDPSDPLPTGGISTPWYYVRRLLSDTADGAAALWTAWHTLLPPSFLNLLYASVVILITLGLLKRFLE